MTRNALVERIEAESGIEAIPRYSNQIETSVPPGRIVSFLSFLKTIGFGHLSNITAIDWMKDGTIEVVYNVWSYSEKVHITVKSPVHRDNPVSFTCMGLWPQGRVYEQELHEMFGVSFQGNPTQGPLFLHNWKDIPPLRKDFDTEEYSRRVYGYLEEEQ